MFAIRHPSPARCRELLRHCEESGFNHPAVGPEAFDSPPSGFKVDRYGTELGMGEAMFRRAVEALESFRMYPPEWTRVFADQSPFKLGSSFMAMTHQLGLWTLLPGRIIESTEEVTDAQSHRCFAFGTLHGHAEAGVERFGIRWDHRTDRVFFEALAISRPMGLVRLATPIARHYQTRFHHQSPQAIATAITPPPP